MATMIADIYLDGRVFIIARGLLTLQKIGQDFRSVKISVPKLSEYIRYLNQKYLTTYTSSTQIGTEQIRQTLLSVYSRLNLPFFEHALFINFKETLTACSAFHSLRGTITETVMTIIFGYLIITLLCINDLRRRKLYNPDSHNTERLIHHILRQTGAILKVIMIITIEFIIFPIFCGIILDFACLPLFAEATEGSKWQNFRRFTFAGTCLHWYTGRVYLSCFAMFVSVCRGLLRPGALYFIRCLNYPQFYSIREIVERPTLYQLRQTGVNGIIYALLILTCFGLVTRMINITIDVFPLRILTLKAVLLVLFTWLFSKPFVNGSVTKAVWKWWFTGTARTLRLSSFLFGTRIPDEEVSIPFNFILFSKKQRSSENFLKGVLRPNGSFLRVPATDTIPLHRRTEIFIPVTENNERLDGQKEAKRRRHRKYFRVVYIPPHFSIRIALLFVWMWVFAVATGLSVTLLPCTSFKK